MKINVKRILNLIFLLSCIVLIFCVVAYVSRYLVLFVLPAVSGSSDIEYKFVISVINTVFLGNNQVTLLFVVTPIVIFILSAIHVFSLRAALKLKFRATIGVLIFIFYLILFFLSANLGLFYGFYIAKSDFSISYFQVVETIDADPAKVGITVDQNKIAELLSDKNANIKYKLLSNDDAVSITETLIRSEIQGEYSGFAIVSLTEDNWEYVSPSVLKQSDFAYKNTLYINSINKRTFNTISLPLAKSLVSQTFPELKVKDDPKVTIVTLTELKVIKNERIQKSLEIINQALTEIDSWIALWEKDLVLITGYYNTYGGTYWQNEIAYDKTHIEELKSDKADWEASKKFFTEQLNEDPYEYGLFYYPDVIYLVLDENYNNHVMTFVPTIVHEYLHYMTYNESVNYDDISGLEEGITDYLTMKIMQNGFDSAGEAGYAELVTIVGIMDKDIPKGELISSYIAGDKAYVVELIKKEYGEDFYNNNIGLINSLAYPMESSKSTSVLNTILENLKNAKK